MFLTIFLFLLKAEHGTPLTSHNKHRIGNMAQTTGFFCEILMNKCKDAIFDLPVMPTRITLNMPI